MRWWALVSAVLLLGCGGEPEQKAPEPAPAETVAAPNPSEQPAAASDPSPSSVLTEEEQARLEQQFAREALAAINADNAEAEGWRMLQRVNDELAAERAAAAAQPNPTGGPQ